jgi:magnesium transporter
MSDAARPAETLDDPACDDPDSAELQPRIRAWAETATGVHAIPIPEAVAAVRRAGDRPPEGHPPFVWIDVAAPGDAEAAFLGERLGFHHLAIEDVLRGRQRPKIDRYPDHFFLVVYEARINPARERMALNEMHAFIGASYVVTVHDHRIADMEQVLARWRAAPERFRSPGSMAHALLDLIVDGYFPVLDHFSERVAELEAGVVDGQREEQMQTIMRMRRELALFRRIVGPERELVGSLLRRDIPLLEPEMLPYFQDVHDHAIRVADEIDTLRDLLAATLEGHRSFSSHQLNETMRLMAAWSIILMAVSWIAGVYGMNFERMPELASPLGHGLALGMMVVLGGVLFVYFRRRGWI